MKSKSATLVVFLAAGLLVGPGGCAKRPAGKPEAAAAASRKWQCPMHPEVVQDGPGDCPICHMKLVPVETGPAPGAAPASAGAVPDLVAVAIDSRKQQLLGLNTVEVARGAFETSIRTVGRIAFDERRVHHVHTRFDAFVEHVEADFTGKFVKKGEVLAHLYSPELFATQQEYLLALRASKTLAGASPDAAAGGRQLLEAARQRLLLWEISPDDIAAIEKRGEPLRAVPVYAPITGYVTGRTAYHGMRVSPSDTLFDIVDLTSVWVLADVYEYELPRLALGQRATMTLSYWPGRQWTGTVTYIYPSLDEKTRTLRVRLDVENPRGELKPEMFADVTIHGAARTVLKVPDDAVLDSGTRKVVFVLQGAETLVPREVRLGDHGGGVYEVLSGLHEGERVAVAANFLVDSESRLKAALAAMAPVPSPAPPSTGPGR